MTSDEAISAAFRAASREMARGMAPDKGGAYEAFLIQTGEYLDGSSQSWARLAEARPRITASQAEGMEMHAYIQILQATIGCLMALGHFPYLPRIDAEVVTEKLC